MKSSVSLKLSLLVAGAVIITALAVNHVYTRANKTILIDAAVSDLRHDVAGFRYPLEKKIEETKEDLRFLAGMRPMRAWMRARASEDGVDPETGVPEQEWKERVADALQDMTLTRKRYMQVRFIDADGREEIRFNSEENGSLRRVPEAELQDKSKRDYVRGALAMTQGQMFYSYPNLNRENGVLDVPYRLTLRIAAPIYGPSGVGGLAVINLDFGRMLAELRDEMRPDRLFYVTNGQGDYLLHPDKFALYAGDVGHSRRIQTDLPEILAFSDEETARGAVYVPNIDEDDPSANALAYAKYKFDPNNADNFIGVAIQKPVKAIMSKADDVKRRGFVAALFVALALAPISVGALYALLRPLRHITRAMTRYREGEKNVSLSREIRGRDEISTLAREFTALATACNEEDWIKEKKIEICGDLLHCRDMKEFGQKLTSLLAPAAGAQLAVFHVREDVLEQNESDETQTHYVLAGSWGFDPNDYKDNKLFSRFALGEGLAGACAAEGKMTVVSAPKNYLHIGSGLGEGLPARVILLPIPVAKHPIAVLELASLGEFTSMRANLVERIAFILELAIKQASAVARANYLLEQAQQAAEELRAQQEELEVANKETEEKNDELREQATELEETQRQVQEKITELKQADRYKSEFLANMSHELRTPLNSMLILSDAWRKNDDGNLTAAQVEEAEIVYGGGMELLGLINDILDLSKIEAGRLTAEPLAFSLDRLTEKLVKQFSPIAKSKNLGFETSVDASLPKEMFSDRRRIDQILKNLLSNAFKFTHKGEVRLDVRPQGEGRVAFAVTDTGVGVKREKRDEIFRAFRQEDGGVDRRYGGTGLGLTIARKFARLLGGDVTVDGEKGKGSVFTLTLPLKYENLSALTAEKAEIKTKNDVKTPVVMAVECDGAAVAAVRLAASRSGARFLHAKNAADAFALVDAQSKGVAVLPDALDSGSATEWLEHMEKHAPHVCAVIYASETPKESDYVALRRFTDHIVLANETLSEDVLADEIHGILSAPAPKRSLMPTGGVKMRHDAGKALEGRKILVVDDDLRNSFAICRALKKHGMHTVVADNGVLGLQKLEEHADIELILTDIMMPEMDGYAFIRAVRAKPAHRALPVIALTAYAMPNEQEKCMAAGANDYLSKPLDVERTVNLLRVWLFKQEEAA
ncbi:MAG: ATP-binding protein [Rickettsiales bacterium]